MNDLKTLWENEEKCAIMKGWDFSYIEGRYIEHTDFGWNYQELVRKYLKKDMRILDIDTGGAEVLLSFHHPYHLTSCTEGYAPNIKLCEEKLLPLGIDFRSCDNPETLPFVDNTFDLVINRHGSFDPKELYRVLKKDGLFITQQVGDQNNRNLVEFLLPRLPKRLLHWNLGYQKQLLLNEGFEIIEEAEAFRTMDFYDIGAFVWYAKIIEWEFIGFSVNQCFDSLLKLHDEIQRNGSISGIVHRYMIVARK